MILLRMKKKTEMIKIICSYPKCKNKATVTLSLADPDAEKIPYCEDCSEKVKMKTYLEIMRLKIKLIKKRR